MEFQESDVVIVWMLGFGQDSDFRPSFAVSIIVNYNIVPLRLPVLVVIIIVQEREIFLMSCFWNQIEVRKIRIQCCSSLIGLMTSDVLFDARSLLNRRRRCTFCIVIKFYMKNVLMVIIRNVSEIVLISGIYRSI